MGRGILIALCCVCLSFAGQLRYDYLKEQPFINHVSGLSFMENPAVLSLEQPSIRWQQTNSSYFDWQQHRLLMVMPYHDWSMGLSIHYQTIGGLQETYEDGNGIYQTLSTFSHLKSGAMLGLSRQFLSDTLSIGVNTKLYYQKIIDQSMYSFGVDAGLLYRPWQDLSIEWVLNDITTTTFKWNDTVSDQLKTSQSYGMTWHTGAQFIGYRYDALQNRQCLRAGLSFTEYLSLLVNVPVEEPDKSRIKVTFQQPNMDFYYLYDFDSSVNQQNEFGVSIKL